MSITRLVGIAAVFLSSSWALAQDPNITEQPANVTVSVGATVAFTADATSENPPLTWQWWFKESAIDTSANPSAATRILSLTNITLAQAGSYSAVVADAIGGSATSQVATLTVDPTFTKITTGPVVTDSGAWQTPSWWDYDNDGFLDLYVGSSNGDVRYRDGVYRNNGDGTFSALTNAINRQLTDSIFGVVGDYNNDGLDEPRPVDEDRRAHQPDRNRHVHAPDLVGSQGVLPRADTVRRARAHLHGVVVIAKLKTTKCGSMRTEVTSFSKSPMNESSFCAAQRRPLARRRLPVTMAKTLRKRIGDMLPRSEAEPR